MEMSSKWVDMSCSSEKKSELEIEIWEFLVNHEVTGELDK